MSVTFNVVYGNLTKRVEARKSDTVHQLTNICMQKYKIDANMRGELHYNGKRLDSSLPLRLTNLANNSRLTLSVQNVGDSKDKNVNVKLMVVLPDNTTHTFISTVPANIMLLKLVESMEKSNNVNLMDVPGYYMKLSVVNTQLSSLDERFTTVRLNSIIGLDVSSLVIRLSYSRVDNHETVMKQKEIVKKQLEEQQKWNERRESERVERERQTAQEKELSEIRDEPMDEAGEEEDTSNQAPLSRSMEQPPQPSISNASQVEPSAVDSRLKAQPTPQNNQQKPESAEYFVPSDKRYIYENSDDDYDMTVTQAQKYHKLIQESATRKTPKQARKPQSYSVRIKFPDRSLLQLAFAADSRFGQILKELDHYILPAYKNNYHLKVAYPPFKKLEFSFSANNTRLDEHGEFGSNENIVLLWEVADGNASGPFIDTKLVNARETTELPEIQLESNRGQLPDDTPKPPGKKSTWLQKTFKK
ncbi:hypothetical protein JA9_001092 [Meyerozyma sp. JA9]|nr:hypothetical protein JA9_001092 [Meyerozyma sp. JA9]